MRPGGGWRAKSRRGPALQIRCGPGDCSGSSPGEIAATTQLSHGLRWPRHKRSIAVIRPPWKHTRHRTEYRRSQSPFASTEESWPGPARQKVDRPRRGRPLFGPARQKWDRHRTEYRRSQSPFASTEESWPGPARQKVDRHRRGRPLFGPARQKWDRHRTEYRRSQSPFASTDRHRTEYRRSQSPFASTEESWPGPARQKVDRHRTEYRRSQSPFASTASTLKDPLRGVRLVDGAGTAPLRSPGSGRGVLAPLPFLSE